MTASEKFARPECWFREIPVKEVDVIGVDWFTKGCDENPAEFKEVFIDLDKAFGDGKRTLLGLLNGIPAES